MACTVTDYGQKKLVPRKAVSLLVLQRKDSDGLAGKQRTMLLGCTSHPALWDQAGTLCIAHMGVGQAGSGFT